MASLAASDNSSPLSGEACVRLSPDECSGGGENAHEFFDSPRYELSQLFDYGDTVVAALSFYARAHGTEYEIVQEEAHTWTLRDGRIARFEWGRDLGTALEAADVRQ